MVTWLVLGGWGGGLPLSWYSAGGFSLMSRGFVGEVVPGLSRPLVVGRWFSSLLRKGLRMMGIVGDVFEARICVWLFRL